MTGSLLTNRIDSEPREAQLNVLPTRHLRRVQYATLALARELGVTDEDTLCALEAAALLHDTGKIAVPEHILNKPGPLTAAEFETVKRHAPIGAQILASIEFPYPVAPVVRHHHENWDGTGYPDRLKGEEIPLGARILSVIACFDALTSDRPYRGRMTEQQALHVILDRRGTQYDPAVVDSFISCYERIMPVTDGGTRPSRAPEPVAAIVEDGPAMGAEGISDAVLALASLSRALAGDARLCDVGALLWMMLRQIIPGDAMALFLPDETDDHVVIRYAAGLHAAALPGVTRPIAMGIAGWAAVNRRSVLNAEAALDLGFRADSAPALRSCLVVPLVDSDALVAVLAFYSTHAAGFTDDHLRLLEVLAPRLANALVDSAIADQDSQLVPTSVARSLKLVQSS